MPKTSIPSLLINWNQLHKPQYINTTYTLLKTSYQVLKSCSQAFAWFSELLVEHAEIFWALFAVDMDRVLTEQPPDTWDSFPLFQILNDYLRLDGEWSSINKLRPSLFINAPFSATILVTVQTPGTKFFDGVDLLIWI